MFCGKLKKTAQKEGEIVDIKEVLNTMDSLNYTEIEGFIVEKLKEAKEEEDNGSRITLLNEIIGFCRDTCQYDKSKQYSGELLEVLDEEHLQGTIEYATSLLNIANASRAAGELDESMNYYKQTLEIYDKNLPADNFLYASLNNNMSLLYQQMQDFASASDCLRKALKVIESHPEKIIEKAITLSNLAQSLLREMKYEEARESIEAAMAIYDDGRQEDFHYSAALNVLAELYFVNKQYGKAADYYDRAIIELEMHTGKNANGEILKENRDRALALARENGQETEQIGDVMVKGIDICRSFYEEYGRPMIHDKFEKYESRIVVGLVGEGSDCFGFDDSVSRDHDWGPGFCMWLDDATYDVIGEALQAEYEKLPTEYQGYVRRTTREARNRTGVSRIKAFYASILNLEGGVPKSEADWLSAQEENLAVATNGAIFRDDEGMFTSVRNTLLSYYPEGVFRRKLAYELVRMAQTGQYNFIRCIKRQDRVTASMYLAEYMEHTLHILYLLNRTYAPYKKWLLKGAADLEILPEITDILRAIADMDLYDENITGSIEIIAKLILGELQNQKLVISLNKQDAFYLEPYGNDIFASIAYLDNSSESARISKEGRKDELVEMIVKLEWDAFDKVINEGGRAGCQDDWTTFSIMRKSQYLTWSEDMLESYIYDFNEAAKKGWNLITEKYGRMEASTAPDRYALIESSLPYRDDKTKAIVEEIVKIQVGFMEELAEEYPHVAGNARSIHTYEDNPFNTSYETYLRGELLTYSEETLGLYGQYVVNYVQSGKNIAYDIMTNSAHLYGYKSLDELEERMKM